MSSSPASSPTPALTEATARAAVLAALQRLPQMHTRTPPAVAVWEGQPCPHCGHALTARNVRWGWIVPPVHRPAAPQDETDHYALCADCSARRGASDLLEAPPIGPAGEALLDRRRLLLLQGAQHPTRHRERPAVVAALAARVLQPRATLVSAVGPTGWALLGWSNRSGGPVALGALAHRLRSTVGAQRMEQTMGPDGAVLLHAPAQRGLDAVWAAIDAGALIVPAVPSVPSAFDWRTAWPLHWYGLSTHLLRLDRTTLFPVPMPERVYSSRPDAERKRAQRARRAALV